MGRRQWHPTPVLLPGESHGWRSRRATVHGVAESQTWLNDFTFTFHFHALEDMATHSSVLAWRIPGTEEPGGLPSMGSHRVGHNWSDLAADILWIHWRVCASIANTRKWVLFLPPSDVYVRSFLYLLYTLIKLYYTKARAIKPRLWLRIEFFSSRGQGSQCLCMVQQPFRVKKMWNVIDRLKMGNIWKSICGKWEEK